MHSNMARRLSNQRILTLFQNQLCSELSIDKFCWINIEVHFEVGKWTFFYISISIYISVSIYIYLSPTIYIYLQVNFKLTADFYKNCNKLIGKLIISDFPWAQQDICTFRIERNIRLNRRSLFSCFTSLLQAPIHIYTAKKKKKLRH